MLETNASRDPIVVVAAPPAVAASLGGVIRVCCRGPMVVVRHMAQTMLAGASFGPVFVIAAQFNPPSPYKTYVEPIYTLKTLVSMK